MEILYNSNASSHHQRFMRLCSMADELLLVSPFCFPDFSSFANEIADIGTIRKITFITTLEREGVVGKVDQLISFCREMERICLIWELRLDEALHGKIYIFKANGHPFASIITSANLTHNGMVANHEWGCVIEDERMLAFIEKQVIDDAPIQLTESIFEEIKERAKMKYPEGVKKEPVATIDIEDILHPFQIPQDTRIFIKPVGVSSNPIYKGDFSKDTDMYFSKKRPNAVRVGDILITYAVGGRKIMGAYKVKSEPQWDIDGDPRWPWYVESDCLTPCLANRKWADIGYHVTGVANEYGSPVNPRI